MAIAVQIALAVQVVLLGFLAGSYTARASKHLFLFLVGLGPSYLLACVVASAVNDFLPIARPTTPTAVFLLVALSLYLLSTMGIYVAGVDAVLRHAARRSSLNVAAEAMTVVLVAAQSVFFLVCVNSFSAALAAVLRQSERRAILIASAVLACVVAYAFFYKESGVAVILGRGAIRAAA